MHICLLSCSFYLFCFLSVPGLSLGLWDLVPWPGIESGPLQCECRAPVTEPMLPLKLESWVEVIMLAGLSGSVDHLCSLKLLCIFRNPSSPAFILEIYRVVYNVETKVRHDSYLKLLSVDWGAGEQKKKKKQNYIYISYALSVLPLA